MSLLGPWWLTTVGGAAIAATVAWAWRREVALGRAAWRRAALLLMGVCLWWLLAEPAGKIERGAESAVLISAETSPAALAALPRDLLRLALPGAPPGSGDAVVDLELAVRGHSSIERWMVAGVGLEAWQLESLPGEVTFLAPERPGVGIDRARWNRRVSLGGALEVRGSVRLAPEVEARLRLVGPAGLEGEVTVVDGSPYALRATPRQPGRLLYRLELSVEDDVLVEERVDVEVIAPRAPRLLWVEGAPSFESREVKSWLRDLGGELVVRSQISRGRFRYEFVNRESRDFDRLSATLLADFDVLVLDGAAWSSLGRSEIEGVEEAVGAGLGLLWVPPLPEDRELRLAGASFAIEDVGDLETMEVEPKGPGLEIPAPLTVTARQFVERPGERPLVSDAAGRPLAALRPLGQGRVAATVVEGSHRWVLRGQGASHRAYWSHLLSALSRPERGPRFALPQGPVWTDRATTIALLSDHEGALELVGPEERVVALAPIQDPFEPHVWRATLWPREVGWHRIRLRLSGAVGDEVSAAFFVAGAGEWSAARQRQAHDATWSRALLGGEGPVVDASSKTDTRRVDPTPWPRWPVFTLLVVAWALLWSDEQWRGTSSDPSSAARGA